MMAGTFVVLDFESTGLPSPGNNPKITELCFIAVTRGELLTKQKAPRVVNKLLLCLNPVRAIHHRSSELTGLHNDSLSCQAKFRDQAGLIVTFLQNLQKPVCLLAHNGNRFDFPLLKAELNGCQMSLPDDILCADTLEAFRVFDELPPVPQFVQGREREKQVLLRLKEDTEAKEADPILQAVNSTVQSSVQDDDKCQSETAERKKTHTARDLGKTEFVPTPSTSNEKEGVSLQLVNETTPDKKHEKDSHPPKANNFQVVSNSIDGKMNVRKRLFPSSALDVKNNAEGAKKPHKSYALGKLYSAIFGQEPEISHTAEDDCKLILKIISGNLHRVIEYCDEKSILFSTIEPMY